MRSNDAAFALLALCACRNPQPSKGESAPSTDVESAVPDSDADSDADSSADSEPAETSESTPDSAPDSAPPEEDPSDAVFDPSLIHVIRLEMDESEWADIRDNPTAKSWHTATFRWCPGGAETCEAAEEEVVEDIGVRAFGNGSLVSGKPSLKISFDHVTAGTRWRELEQIKLDNSSQDLSFLRERICTAVLRRWDLPAARTGWASVLVNDEPVGFFVLLESIDDRFLVRWTGDKDGNLYGTAGTTWGHGLEPMDDPFVYFDVQTSNPTDGSDLLAAADALATGTDEELQALVDIDGFTRISVARSVLGATDTYSGDANNYYLYVKDGFVRQIPWDFDNDVGGFSAYESRLSVPVEAPWTVSSWAYDSLTGEAWVDHLHERAIEMGADLDGLVDELLGEAADLPTIDAEITASEALISDAVWADTLGYGPTLAHQVVDTRLWMNARLSALAGREVAECAPLPTDGLPVAELDPVGTVGWGSLTADSTPLGPGFTVNGEHYCTGLWAHAPSEVTVTVPDGYGALSGAVGLQDWWAACGSVVFSIEQGGVTLWTSDTMMLYQDAEPFDGIAVAPGEVTLVADMGTDYYCDHASWLDVVATP